MQEYTQHSTKKELFMIKAQKSLTKLFGLQWQGAPSKTYPGNTGFDSQGEQRLANVHVSTYEPD